jgi:hypothetical protein
MSTKVTNAKRVKNLITKTEKSGALIKGFIGEINF